MPALSYKERFCVYVKNYTKTQSIRAFRKRPFKPGDKLMHYFGMRTKFCIKLIPDNTCRDINTIFLFGTGNIFIYPSFMPKREARRLLRAGEIIVARISKKLNDAEKDLLAYHDGFRPNSLQDVRINKRGCFAEMFNWWQQTHSLPFTGQLIKWERPETK